MPYLNLDDNYPDHPKVEALSDAAYRLHGATMFYAARFGLDGHLTRAQLRARRCWSTRTELELVAGGLLHTPGQGCDSEHCPADDGTTYRLHDFLEWNKPAAWWAEQREQGRRRKAAWAERARAGKAEKRTKERGSERV